LKHKLFHLNKEDVVILIQDRSFRLSDFRIRLDLKNKGIYVIEHNHIDHTTSSEEIETYVKALQYDGNYFESVASMMQKKLGTSSEVKIVSCDGSELTYSGPVESVKKNIGDLHANLGSFYPIGEVFTEPVDLESVSGEFLVYAFPNLQYKTIIVDPFKVIVRKGKVVSHNGPKEFSEIIDLIKTENSDEKVWIREMGFGLNRNIGKNKPLTFVSAHERQQGYHISLGLKHGVFRKKIPKKVNQRFHIDMFVDVSKMLIDGECVFSEEKYLIE